MTKLDRLLVLAEKHGCDSLSSTCEVCTEIQQLMNEINQALKLQEIIKERIKQLNESIQE